MSHRSHMGCYNSLGAYQNQPLRKKDMSSEGQSSLFLLPTRLNTHVKVWQLMTGEVKMVALATAWELATLCPMGWKDTFLTGRH